MIQTETHVSSDPSGHENNNAVDKVYSAYAFSKAFREGEDPLEVVAMYQGMMDLRKNWSDEEFDEFYNKRHPGLGIKYREQSGS